jgi:hypothetical protein
MHPIEPIHFSRLKLMQKSAAHVLSYQRPDTASLQKGRHFHRVLLGKDGYKIWGGKRAGKQWLKFKAANDGVDIVTLDEHTVAEEMAESVRSHPEVKRLGLLDGAKEETLRWRWLGMEWEGTPDILCPHRHLVDIKSARDSEPDRFQRQGRWLAYHGQLWAYRNGAIVNKLCDDSIPVYTIATEPFKPYVTTVFLDKGGRLVRLWAERLRGCIEMNEFPGYASGVVDFDVPDTDMMSIGFEEEDDGDESDVA